MEEPLKTPQKLDKKEMKRIQREIAEKAVFNDQHDFDRNYENIKVAGIDQAFLDNKAVSGVVVMENGEVIEKSFAATEIDLPYIPGLLAFREGRPILKALEKLETEPDLLMFDGNGRIHYRQAGIATHIGVVRDKPSIGIAKNLLCGKPVEDISEMEEDEKVPIRSNEDIENLLDKVIGYAYQSRQYPESKKINPLYISPGHRVSAETSVKIAEEFTGKYKLPEPVRKADKLVGERKKDFKD